MKITSYRITEDAHIAEIAAAVAIEGWQRNAGQFWIDIQAEQTEELEQWLKQIKVSELAIQCCMQPASVSRVLPLDDAAFFSFPIYTQSSRQGAEAGYISCLCLQNLFISIYNGPYTGADRLIHALTSDLRLAAPTTSGLVCIMLASESSRIARSIDLFRTTAFALDERMDHDPDSVEADAIRDQRRVLRVYDTIVSGQAACFELLRSLEKPFLNLVELTTHFQFATANSHAALLMLSRLDKTVSDLSQRFDANQQEKTNHRLAVLTILSAIFMPLTLIAGIYGMNFEKMPELQFALGYPIVLVGMLLIAGAMYRFFKTRGWLVPRI